MMKRYGWRVFSITILMITFGFSTKVEAAANAAFCTRTKVDLLNTFLIPENRIAFQNNGGLGGGGVCWWHSRLQRSSVYLAQYAPEKPKPTIAQATRLVRALVFFSQVVEIPGYANFYEFSLDYESVVQKELNDWQIRDGFVNQQWIRGLYGSYTLPAATLHEHMDSIYQAFLNSQEGIWVMVQLKGISSHALLIIGMAKTANGGYNFDAIDSNYPGITRSLQYQVGDQSLDIGNSGSIADAYTPYLGFQKDFSKINRAIQKYCGQ